MNVNSARAEATVNVWFGNGLEPFLNKWQIKRKIIWKSLIKKILRTGSDGRIGRTSSYSGSFIKSSLGGKKYVVVF